MRHYTWRTLFQRRGRAALSIGGVALALVLIIALDAVFLGAERQSTRYIDHAGADIIVSQTGVRTMHMAASTIPLTTIEPTRAVSGVASATPVLFASDIMRLGDVRASVYVIGLAEDATAGLPPTSVAGQAAPGPGGAVIDEGVAHRAGLDLGDTVTLLGRPFRLDGLSAGTAGLVNSVAVISLSDFSAIRGSGQNISFLFVTVTPGTSVSDVASRIQAAVDGVTVQTRDAFAAEERALIRDMGTNVILVMNLLGFLIGLAIMALTVYLAMLARRAEFGMLKAVGASNRSLYRVVILQALASVAVGFVLAIAVTLALSALLPRLGSNVTLEVGGTSLIKALMASLIIAGLAAGLPIKRIAGLDPAVVFRGG